MIELLLVLLAIVLASYAFALRARDLLASVLWTAVGGFATAACFFLMQAPDVAMSQAAVGGGLIPLIFIIAISKTERFEKSGAVGKTERSET